MEGNGCLLPFRLEGRSSGKNGIGQHFLPQFGERDNEGRWILHFKFAEDKKAGAAESIGDGFAALMEKRGCACFINKEVLNLGCGPRL